MAEKLSLPTASGPSKLGRPTIMDPALAAAHGVDYVHLAACAIDLDRIREAVEGYGDPRPFGWEVFLTEQYMFAHFDPIRSPRQVVLFEDIVMGVLEGQVDALGSQIVFAVWDAIVRGRFPKRLEAAFASWEARPDELVRDLDVLFEEETALRSRLAEGCLAVELDPPLAPPTQAALAALSQTGAP
ncbi:MAG: hypothetical protein AB8I08_01670 [Sandaracinaceae bacterium]